MLALKKVKDAESANAVASVAVAKERNNERTAQRNFRGQI